MQLLASRISGPFCRLSNAANPNCGPPAVDIPGMQVLFTSGEAVQPFATSVLTSIPSSALAGLMLYSLFLGRQQPMGGCHNYHLRQPCHFHGINGARLQELLHSAASPTRHDNRTWYMLQGVGRVYGHYFAQPALGIPLDLPVFEGGPSC